MPAWLAPAITAGMGLIGGATQNNKDNRQIRQQEKLYDVAEQSNKHMAMFNHDLQMQMWRDTGPVGQMEQLKKAGLNPGLIYGMGGAGGQTAAAAQAQGVSSAQAPSGSGREIEEMAGMGLAMASQVALMDAQKRNIDADTANKQAQTTKTSGADTELTEAETALKQIEYKFQDATLEQRIANIANEGTKIMSEMRTSMANANIADSTQETVIQQYKETLAGTILSNTYTGQQTEESKARIKKIGEDIAQGWKGLSIQEKKNAIEQQLANLKAEFPDMDNVFARDIRAALDKMWNIINPGMKREEASRDYRK